MSYHNVDDEQSKINLEDLPTKNEGSFDIYENHKGCFCTDFYCLILFLLGLLAVVIIFFYGFKTGNPMRLVAPLSQKGEFCGLKGGEKKEFPYLYMPQFPLDLSNGSVCVNHCPSPGRQCILEDGSVTDATDSCSTTLTTFPFNDTIPIMYRCIPNIKAYLADSSVYGSFSDFFSIVVSDLLHSWWVLLIALFLTIFVSVLFLCFVRFCSKCIVWGSIISCVLVVLGLGIWILSYGVYSLATGSLKTDKTSSQVFIAFGIVFILTAALVALIALCCLRGQIGLAVQVISEASRALGDVWSIYLSPLFYLLLFALAVVGFVTTMVYYCAGVEITTTDGVKSLNLKTSQRVTVIVAFFIFLWVTMFLVGCNEATIAGAATAWYFTKRKELLGNFMAGASACTLFLHHLGSVAVGSFLIALVYFIRAVVLYLDRKMKEEGLKESKVVKCLCSCLSCCLACVSRVLEYVTSSAYIVMSVYGTNFFSSAGTAIKLLAQNPVRSAVLSGISYFVVLCLELCVTAIVTTVCVLILRPSMLGISGGVEVYYWWAMAFACFLFSLVLSVFLFHVYSFLLRVIFLCYLIDEELSHKSGGSNPHYASTNLKMSMDDVSQVGSGSSGGSTHTPYYSGGGATKSPKSTASAGNVDY